MAYLRLNVSNLCTFSCKYCHVFKLMKNKLPLKVMDFEIMDSSIKNFIEILKRYGENFLTLSVYGGEPLINKKNLFRIIEKYGNEHAGVKLDWWVYTNGSLITEEILDFFKRYNVDIHISVDGAKETHNKNRVDKFNKGTFDRVESALELIKAKKVRAQINSFVFPENINNLSDMVDIAKRFDINRVHIDMFYDTQERAISSDIISKKYFEAYKYGLKNGVYVFGPWSRILRRYLKQDHQPHKTPSINITVNGKFSFFLYPLMEPIDLKYLNYNDIIDSYSEAYNKFFALVRDNCKYCFLRKSCNGSMIYGFMYHTMLNKGWKRSCESIKEIIKLIKNS